MRYRPYDVFGTAITLVTILVVAISSPIWWPITRLFKYSREKREQRIMNILPEVAARYGFQESEVRYVEVSDFDNALSIWVEPELFQRLVENLRPAQIRAKRGYSDGGYSVSGSVRFSVVVENVTVRFETHGNVWLHDHGGILDKIEALYEQYDPFKSERREEEASVASILRLSYYRPKTVVNKP